MAPLIIGAIDKSFLLDTFRHIGRNYYSGNNNIFINCQLLGRSSELPSVPEEAKFFLYIASKTKERAAMPKPTQPKTKGMA
jgi:hypothetical protein